MIRMHADISAAMTSVSEFLGFLVIRIFPCQGQRVTRSQRQFYHRSDDALSSHSDHFRDGPLAEDARMLSRDDHGQLVPSNGAVQQPVVAESSTEHSALRNPAFWKLAFIMSMRISLLCSC
jgi:hypothetical protein